MLLVLMSLEKCFAVYFPLKSKIVCTVRSAKWSTSVVGVIIAGYDSLYFFVTEYEVSSCVFAGNFRIIMDNVDSALYSFGPFAFMFITNSTIAFKFMKAKCNLSNSTESTNQALGKAATPQGDSYGGHCFHYIFTPHSTSRCRQCFVSCCSPNPIPILSSFHEFNTVSKPQYQWHSVLHCGV